MSDTKIEGRGIRGPRGERGPTGPAGSIGPTGPAGSGSGVASFPFHSPAFTTDFTAVVNRINVMTSDFSTTLPLAADQQNGDWVGLTGASVDVDAFTLLASGSDSVVGPAAGGSSQTVDADYPTMLIYVTDGIATWYLMTINNGSVAFL